MYEINSTEVFLSTPVLCILPTSSCRVPYPNGWTIHQILGRSILCRLGRSILCRAAKMFQFHIDASHQVFFYLFIVHSTMLTWPNKKPPAQAGVQRSESGARIQLMAMCFLWQLPAVEKMLCLLRAMILQRCWARAMFQTTSFLITQNWFWIVWRKN